MISIVMTDAGGHETHQAMSRLGSHAPYRLCMGQTRGLFVLMDSLRAWSQQTQAGCLLSRLSHVIANRETDHHFVSITTFNISLSNTLLCDVFWLLK